MSGHLNQESYSKNQREFHWVMELMQFSVTTDWDPWLNRYSNISDPLCFNSVGLLVTGTQFSQISRRPESLPSEPVLVSVELSIVPWGRSTATGHLKQKSALWKLFRNVVKDILMPDARKWSSTNFRTVVQLLLMAKRARLLFFCRCCNSWSAWNIYSGNRIFELIFIPVIKPYCQTLWDI